MASSDLLAYLTIWEPASQRLELFKPSSRAIGKRNEGQHDRDFNQHTHNGGQGRAGIEAKEADRHCNC